MYKLKHCILAIALAGVLSLAATQSSFGQNLIVNGTFTNYTSTSGTNGGQIGYNVTVNSWSTTGYNFIFTNGNVGDVNVTGSDGSLSLYGPNNGHANGLVAPPGGGNTVADDGAYEVQPLTQVVSGLTSGKTYAVSFEWAGAQQTSFTGGTTESWTVDLGSAAAQTTTVVSVPQAGFSGWMAQTFYFTADGASDTLSFLANGTPTGEPPFALLGDVSLTVVPEPKAASGLTILFGMLLLGGNWAWRRLPKLSSTNA